MNRLSGSGRLLVIKVNQLGDCVVFLPALQEFSRRFPQWKLSIMTTAVGRQVFAHLPAADQFIEIAASEFSLGWRNPKLIHHLFRWVRQQEADALLLGVEPVHTAHLLAFLSGCPLRVGVQPPKRTVPGSLHCLSPWQEGQPIAAVNWQAAEKLASCLGGATWTSTVAAPHFLEDATAPVSRDTIVLHPGASREYQRWPLDHYASLAGRLLASGHRVEVIGAARDLMDLPQQGLVPKILGRFNDLVQTLRGARLLICNNSGPMHVASALGVPTVVISGPSSPVWDPIWHQDKIQVLREPTVSCQPCDRWNLPADHCHRTDEPLICLRHWTVEKVEQKVHEQLAKTTA